MKLLFISDRIVFHISYAHTPNVTVYNGLCGFSQDTVDLQTAFPLFLRPLARFDITQS